eukprot:gene15312-biopygen6260
MLCGSSLSPRSDALPHPVPRAAEGLPRVRRPVPRVRRRAALAAPCRVSTLRRGAAEARRGARGSRPSALHQWARCAQGGGPSAIRALAPRGPARGSSRDPRVVEAGARVGPVLNPWPALSREVRGGTSPGLHPGHGGT